MYLRADRVPRSPRTLGDSLSCVGVRAAPSYRLNRHTTPEVAGAKLPDDDPPVTFDAQQTLGEDDRGQRGAGGGVGANGDKSSTRGHSGGHDGAGGYGLDGAGGNLAQFTATHPDTHEEVGGRGGDGGANPLMDFQLETIAGTEHPTLGENNPTPAPGTGPDDRADAAVGEKHGETTSARGHRMHPPRLPELWGKFSRRYANGE